MPNSFCGLDFGEDAKPTGPKRVLSVSLWVFRVLDFGFTVLEFLFHRSYVRRLKTYDPHVRPDPIGLLFWASAELSPKAVDSSKSHT